SSFRELHEDALQERATVVRFAATGPQPCQIDGAAQFPTTRALASAQFKRPHERDLRVVNSRHRRREESASLYPQRFRHEEELSLLLDLADRVVDQCHGFVGLSDCKETLRENNLELRITHPIVQRVEVLQAVLKSFNPGSCIAAADGQGALVAVSD